MRPSACITSPPNAGYRPSSLKWRRRCRRSPRRSASKRTVRVAAELSTEVDILLSYLVSALAHGQLREYPRFRIRTPETPPELNITQTTAVVTLRAKLFHSTSGPPRLLLAARTAGLGVTLFFSHRLLKAGIAAHNRQCRFLSPSKSSF